MAYKILLLTLFIFILASCSSNKKELTSLYNNYNFDFKTIEKLSTYDSLVQSINENFKLFQQKINEKEAYQAYRYKPGVFEIDVFNKLPEGVSPNIDHYYAKLGDDFIKGFDVYKDSSIKIYIKSYPSSLPEVDIEEYLSYYPKENSIRKREFPFKDTILTKHWQYWIRFHSQSLF